MFESSYAKLPDRFYEQIKPEVYQDSELVLYNPDLATELDLNIDHDEMLRICSGQSQLGNSPAIALAYAGAQFGHFVPELGDGRAHLIGEAQGYDIQLKGSGRTRFSRGGDGRSALGPVIREFLVSEAMHALGIPTTRSLCMITTGEKVMRQYGAEPGGVLARVASSHIRVGTFQYFSSRADHEALDILLDYTLRRHYPEIRHESLSDRCLSLLQSFAKRQRDLVASWYEVGFIHGVMNTDNCALAGITIDYGPCAFLDEFQFHKVFSSIDAQGRYAYGNQMPIIEWNILRLADCLLPLIADDQQIAISKVKEVLSETLMTFPQTIYQLYARKLGVDNYAETDGALVIDFLQYLEDNALDFTLAFSNLESLYSGECDFYPETKELHEFVTKWKSFSPNLSELNKTNPKLIPRNHQIQNVIDQAYKNNYDPLREMWEALKTPYVVSDEHIRFLTPPEPDERVYQTFCGT